jgi:hypothetical protein
MIWNFRSSVRVIDPVVTGGVGYLPGFSDRVYALNA